MLIKIHQILLKNFMRNTRRILVGIGFDYDILKKKKAAISKGKKVKIPINLHILKRIEARIFKKATTEFNEKSLLIK